MAGTLVRLRGVSLGYRARAVVEGVDLDLEAGCFRAVLGPNGGGKTTLLRGLAGLLLPSAGTLTRQQVRLGYVPQRETLDVVYPLTVLEVVLMGAHGRLDPWGRTRLADRGEAERALEEVQLTQQSDSLFSRLSGGQRQRALLARALVARPNLLLLDEPTSGVDARTSELIHSLLQRLAREEGLGVVLVSHQLEMVQGVDAASWVEEGRVDELDLVDLARRTARPLFLPRAAAPEDRR